MIEHESSTTPYDWVMNGRISVSCYGNSCAGYYTAPTSGTQMIQGAILRLQRSDSSVVVAQCVSKVNIFSSIMMAADALNANDPNSPTVYRDCRSPDAHSTIEAEFRLKHDTVKLFWHYYGSGQIFSETYAILGVLRPSSSQPPVSQPAVFQALLPLPSFPAYTGPAPAVPEPAVQASRSLTDMKTFSYPADGYSISFPAEPQIDPSAEHFKLRSYIAPDDSVNLLVGVGLNSVDSAGLTQEDVLQQAENHCLEASGSRLLRQRDIKLGNYPGIEFEIVNATIHSSFRVYLVGSTLYQMSVATPAGTSYAETAQFMNSFQLIQP